MVYSITIHSIHSKFFIIHHTFDRPYTTGFRNTLQEGPNHPDFKAVLEEYKDIQFENMKELGRTNIIQHTIQLLDE